MELVKDHNGSVFWAQKKEMFAGAKGAGHDAWLHAGGVAGGHRGSWFAGRIDRAGGPERQEKSGFGGIPGQDEGGGSRPYRLRGGGSGNWG